MKHRSTPNLWRVLYRALCLLAGAFIGGGGHCHPAAAAQGSTTRQLSAGAAWSDVSLTTTLPKISPDSSRVVYRQDATTDGSIDLWSVPLDGHWPPVRLSEPLPPLPRGQFMTFAISADSSRVVYLVDQDDAGKLELYSVAIAGGTPVKISQTVADDRDVAAFEISATSARVVYSQDKERWTKYELYSAPIGGGPSVKLNKAFGFDDDVEGFRTSPNGQTVVYRAGNTDSDEWSLFSVRITGGTLPTKISQDLANGSGVLQDFRITPDGSRVLYLADPVVDEAFVLYAVPILGGPSVALSTTGSVESYDIAADGQSVTYSRRDGAVRTWWTSPLTGAPATPALAPPAMPVTSPDGNWTLHEIRSGGVDELWSSWRGGPLRRLNCPLVAGGDVALRVVLAPAYTISPDSQSVVYVADQAVDERMDLYSTPIGGAVCVTAIFADGFEGGGAGAWR